MRRTVTETSSDTSVEQNGQAYKVYENGQLRSDKIEAPKSQPSNEYKLEIKWLNVLVFLYLHSAAVYRFWLPAKSWVSVAMAWIYTILTGFGTTVAAHRYFTHRTFTANKPLKIILIILQTMTAQEPILHWARDHRVHHKFTDTDADPYNSRRGFFFSHIGWLMCKKHPEVIRQGRKIDMRDLENDPMLKFQKRWYMPLSFLMNFGIPIMLGLYCGEDFSTCWHGNIFRYLCLLHCVWCVNSAAHLWGTKPYDKNLSSTDSRFVGFVAIGEGWHNYHHVFPWDYKASESPNYGFNLSTALIDFFAWLGWATELKTVPTEIVKKRVLRTGDGSHPFSKEIDENNNNNDDKLRDTEHFWGFGDKEMSAEDMKYIKVL